MNQNCWVLHRIVFLYIRVYICMYFRNEAIASLQLNAGSFRFQKCQLPPPPSWVNQTAAVWWKLYQQSGRTSGQQVLQKQATNGEATWAEWDGGGGGETHRRHYGGGEQHSVPTPVTAVKYAAEKRPRTEESEDEGDMCPEAGLLKEPSLKKPP